MKIIKDWRLAMIIYIVAIVVFIILDFTNYFRPYHNYIILSSAILVFLSIVYQLNQRRWVKAILYSAFSFGVTIVGLTALMLIGLFMELFKGSPTVLDEQHYREEFVSNTMLPFPESAHFLAMDDTVGGFGLENEYEANCLIKLSRVEYNNVLQNIKANPKFEVHNTGIDLNSKLVNDVKPKDISITLMHDNPGYSLYTLSFYNNQQTIGIKVLTY